MERSRADRILADWDSISRLVRRPAMPPRRAVTTALPTSTMTGAALLVVVAVAAGIWFGLPRGSAQPGVPASPASTWGPLAVVPFSNGDEARTEGTLRITDTCAFLEVGGTPTLLLWGADRTTWSAETRTITFENFDGTVVTVADGDDVVLGGSGGGRESEAESGIPNEGWVDRTEWVAPPAASCPIDEWWSIGSVQDKL